MGFFDKKAVCDVCSEEVGLNRFKTAEGWICPKCFKACGYTMTTPIKMKTVMQIQKDLETTNSNLDLAKNFVSTKKIGGFVEFDEKGKKFMILGGLSGKTKSAKVYNYSDVIDCDLLEDESSVTNGGLGAAIAGGLLFGGAGAVVGGVVGGKKTKPVANSMKIKVTLNDTSDPVEYIHLLNTPTKTGSFVYKTIESSAQEILSVFAVILNENRAVKGHEVQPVGGADDIRKFKSLLDDGIITQEEFEAKKKQLLGI